jgi:hypothetical protein
MFKNLYKNSESQCKSHKSKDKCHKDYQYVKCKWKQNFFKGRCVVDKKETIKKREKNITNSITKIINFNTNKSIRQPTQKKTQRQTTQKKTQRQPTQKKTQRQSSQRQSSQKQSSQRQSSQKQSSQRQSSQRQQTQKKIKSQINNNKQINSNSFNFINNSTSDCEPKIGPLEKDIETLQIKNDELISIINEYKSTIEESEQKDQESINHETIIKEYKDTIETQKTTIETQKTTIETQKTKIETQKTTIEGREYVIEDQESIIKKKYLIENELKKALELNTILTTKNDELTLQIDKIKELTLRIEKLIEENKTLEINNKKLDELNYTLIKEQVNIQSELSANYEEIKKLKEELQRGTTK